MLGRRIWHVKASSEEQSTGKQPDPNAQGCGWIGQNRALRCTEARGRKPTQVRVIFNFPLDTFQRQRSLGRLGKDGNKGEEHREATAKALVLALPGFRSWFF